MNTQARTESESKMIDMMDDTFGSFIRVASVKNVYGEPVKSGDTVMIPTAEVMGGIGIGTGFGTRPGDGGGRDEGGGGGGGGRVASRPVATVVASPEGVRVEPVIDKTRITLTGMLTGGLIAFMLLRLLRAMRS